MYALSCSVHSAGLIAHAMNAYSLFMPVTVQVAGHSSHLIQGTGHGTSNDTGSMQAFAEVEWGCCRAASWTVLKLRGATATVDMYRRPIDAWCQSTTLCHCLSAYTCLGFELLCSEHACNHFSPCIAAEGHANAKDCCIPGSLQLWTNSAKFSIKLLHYVIEV